MLGEGLGEKGLIVNEHLRGTRFSASSLYMSAHLILPTNLRMKPSPGLPSEQDCQILGPAYLAYQKVLTRRPLNTFSTWLSGYHNDFSPPTSLTVPPQSLFLVSPYASDL